jgi:hypothetical protein
MPAANAVRSAIAVAQLSKVSSAEFPAAEAVAAGGMGPRTAHEPADTQSGGV